MQYSTNQKQNETKQKTKTKAKQKQEQKTKQNKNKNNNNNNKKKTHLITIPQLLYVLLFFSWENMIPKIYWYLLHSSTDKRKNGITVHIKWNNEPL